MCTNLIETEKWQSPCPRNPVLLSDRISFGIANRTHSRTYCSLLHEYNYNEYHVKWRRKNLPMAFSKELIRIFGHQLFTECYFALLRQSPYRQTSKLDGTSESYRRDQCSKSEIIVLALQSTTTIFFFLARIKTLAWFWPSCGRFWVVLCSRFCGYILGKVSIFTMNDVIYS